MKTNLTIDQIENNVAVLKTTDGATVNWPADKLPAGAREGSVFVFDILSDKEAESDKKEQAKNILNEILNTDES